MDIPWMIMVASRVPNFEQCVLQILLNDVRVSEQLVDLVFYLLVLLGAYRQENQTIPNDMNLLRSALVACTLKLLMVIVSSQYQDVAQVLFAYYKVDIFMDAAFSAVCIDVKYLQTKLSIEQAEPTAGITLPTAEETLNHFCQQCDSSLHFLQSFCQQRSFWERMVKNKEACGNGGVLVLVQTILNLKISPSRSTPLYMASISQLKSKALSIASSSPTKIDGSCTFVKQNVSYLDEVASNPRSQNLAKSIALHLSPKLVGFESKLHDNEDLLFDLGFNHVNFAACYGIEVHDECVTYLFDEISTNLLTHSIKNLLIVEISSQR